MVVAVALGGRGNEVLARNPAIGRRIKRSDGHAYRVQHKVRNLVSGEWLLREGIDQRRVAREIALALGERRHIAHLRDPLPRTASLIVGEKERAILTDRPPQRGAKLIALILRVGLIGGRE